MKAEFISRERTQQNAQKLLTSVPNHSAMTLLSQGYLIEASPLHTQGEDLFKEYAAARKSSESIQVLGESPPPEEPAAVASTTPPGASPPSPRLMELDDDIAVLNPEDDSVTPRAPQRLDNVEFNDDIPVWDRDEQPARGEHSNTQQEFSPTASAVYQRHIRRMMSDLNARLNKPTDSLPGVSSTGAGSEGESGGSVDKKGNGKAEQT